MQGSRDEPCQAVLAIIPVSFREVCAFLRQHHRHHRPPQGHKFSVAVSDGQAIVGVAVVGRPVARRLDDGFTAEVTRCCTDGSTKNAASMLYAAARRTAKAMGYRNIITYTLESEAGTSLRAAGWQRIRGTKGGSWSRRDRLREDKHPTVPKVRWECVMAGR